jgi:hypothetical protein
MFGAYTYSVRPRGVIVRFYLDFGGRMCILMDFGIDQ